MTASPAQLYIFADRILWASVGFAGGQTQRPAPALLLGTRGPLALTLPDGTVVHGQVLLVAPQVARGVQAMNAGFCSLNVDPSQRWAARMRESLAGQPVRVLDAGLLNSIWSELDALIGNAHEATFALELTEKILEAVWGEPGAWLDPRVVKVARKLQQALPARLPLDTLATDCQLSPSRLRHLFREQTGVPLRSYLLWLKMHQAAALFARDWSMTAVAVEIGFSDAPHLCRVFRDYFAVNPSWLADTSQVRVHDCRSLGGFAADAIDQGMFRSSCERREKTLPHR